MMEYDTATKKPQRIVLHIGYPKTATTTLQKHVFLPWHKGGKVNYLGVFQTQEKPFDFAALSDQLRDTMYLDDDTAQFHARACNSGLQSMLAHDFDARPIVISSEHFTMGGYSTQRRGVVVWPRRSAWRLRQALAGFDVQVVVVLREYSELAEAYFLQHKARPFHANRNQYVSQRDFVQRIRVGGDPHAEMFRFAAVLDAYAQAFGRSCVHSYAFPEVVQDMESFANTIWRLTGAAGKPPRSRIVRVNARRHTAGGYRSPSFGLASYLATGARRFPRMAKLLRRMWGAGLVYSALDKIKVSNGKAVEAMRPSDRQLLQQVLSEDRYLLREQWGVNL